MRSSTANVGGYVEQIVASFRSCVGHAHSKEFATPRLQQMCLLVAGICFTLVIDFHQFAFMVIGAMFYLSFQKSRSRYTTKTSATLASEVPDVSQGFEDSNRGTRNRRLNPQPRPVPQVARPCRPQLPHIVMKREPRKLTLKPIEKPVFVGVGWEAEVAELISSISPTEESHVAVQHIAGNIRACLQRSYPDVAVLGFAVGDFRRGKAFGVAVPEVDIVTYIKPQVLLNRFMGNHWNIERTSNHIVSKVQKAALRECTEILVSGSKFKFRRSAFKFEEPKVTLLAPIPNSDQGVPIDLSVNATVPLQSKALLTECGRIDTRAKELILLVRRWTKDRGVCHASKGYLSPYLWCLLTIYFLQVGVEEEGSLLPPLEYFDLSSYCPGQQSSTTSTARWSPRPFVGQRKSTASLFKLFVRFYSTRFDWRSEAVSIRLGKRSPPHSELPRHFMDGCGVDQQVEGMSIEDPFMITRNLASCFNTTSFARSREELQRAHELCSRDASLTELLDLWVPTEKHLE